MSPRPDARDIAARYDRWAGAYASVTRRLPVVGHLRDRAVAALDLQPGDRVIDVGCGPGPNLARLREAVDPDGTVVGLDASERMVGHAERTAPPGVDLVRGDARRPPVRGGYDGLLATFVVTLFEEPDLVVARWWDLVDPGGRVVLLNMAPGRGPLAKPLNGALRIGLALTTPGPADEDLVALLDRRLATAHGALAERADRVQYHEAGEGLVRIAVGVKAG